MTCSQLLKASLVPIPIPVFSLLHAEKGEGLVDLVMSHGCGLNWPGRGLDFLVMLCLVPTHVSGYIDIIKSPPFL
jgi:hypothetical protein